MQRTTTTVLAALLVIGTLAVVPVAMAQQTETAETNQTTENTTVSPGEQLSGIVGVGEAELRGEVESGAYDIKIANANSSEAKAALVAEQLNNSEQQLADIESQQAELKAAHENGSISEGQYRAKMATLHAESQNGARLVNQTNETASNLPTETLEANGVNTTALRALQSKSANLTGPETAALAQSIAGKNAGKAARPEEARGGAGDRAGNGSKRAGSDRGAGAPNSTTETGAGSAPTTETGAGSAPTNETSDGSTSDGTSDGSTSSGTSDGSTSSGTSDDSTSSGTGNGGSNNGKY